MARFEAAWILPIATAPIQDGWIEVDGGVIAGVGSGRDGAAIDLGRVAMLPALVNAHTHLELSHLHRQVPPGARFAEWVQALMALRRRDTDPFAPDILDAARSAIRSARASGTGLVGDVSNTLATVALLREAGMPGHVFHELIGFGAPDPGGKVARARVTADAAGAGADVRVSLAPHAPYSVSPALFQAIRADLDAHADARSSVHLGESPEEIDLLRHGTGALRDLLERLGVWSPSWDVPESSPVEYLSRIGFLDSRVLAIHGVQFEREDLRRLAATGATLVSCPRSNRHVGVGAPPLEAFYASGVEVAFGTDSLASVEDVNMFEELAEARRVAPGVPARDLLRSATLAGARALGFGDDLGSLEPGKRAAIIAVQVPTGVEDVEEWLVASGVQPEAIAWAGASPQSAGS